jgi:hypothetical protein
MSRDGLDLREDHQRMDQHQWVLALDLEEDGHCCPVVDNEEPWRREWRQESCPTSRSQRNGSV